MALDATVAAKLVKSILESSPNPASAIITLKDAGVSIEEVVRLSLDHPPLKTRQDEIGAAVVASGGKWPKPILKASAPTTGTTASPAVGKKDTPE